VIVKKRIPCIEIQQCVLLWQKERMLEKVGRKRLVLEM
jgi:hypothetical protein